MYIQEWNKRKQMSEIGTIAIAGVSERDIDLLLLEEFIASPDFASWFVAQIGFGETANALVTDAKRSVTHSTGESDLEILFIDNASRSFKLLIHLWVIGNSISCRSCIRLSKNPPLDTKP